MNTARTASRTSGLSTRAPIIALVALSVLYVPLRYIMDLESTSAGVYNAVYIYGTLLQIVLAAAIVAVAVMIGLRQSVGRQWLLIGLGISMYALGDITWTLFDLFLGIDPYPSIADVFYSLEYLFFFAAIVIAVRAYSGLVKTRVPVIVAAVVGAVGMAANYFVLLKPYIISAGTAELGTWGLIFGVTYPIGDIVLMLAPTVALALVVRQLGAGRLARPWWIVVAGALVFCVVDSFFVYAEWAGVGLPALVDVGYLAANLLFAVAALVAKDTYHIG
jgi:hypothetical protein